MLQIIGKVCGGGVEAVVMNYYRHIDRQQVQFDFIVDGDGTVGFDDEVRRLGGRVYKVEPYTENIFKNIYQIYRVIKDNHYQVVHSHMNTVALFSLFSAFLGGAKIRIIHNHSTADAKEGARSVLKYILRPFSKVFANQYYACSKLAGEWMFGEIAVANGKVRIANNAIDTQTFSYNNKMRLEYREQLGIPDHTFVLGHVGRFVYPKNHTFLIDIFREVVKKRKDAILLLIGIGSLQSTIMEKVQQYGLESNVRFLGIRNDVAALYNVMDVFVLPSWYEGLPVVSVEAQANGLPCLISDRVSDECKITNSVIFMSLDRSAKEWAECILHTPYTRNVSAENELRAFGFDIREEACKLQAFYEKHHNLMNSIS